MLLRVGPLVNHKEQLRQLLCNNTFLMVLLIISVFAIPLLCVWARFAYSSGMTYS